MRYFNYIKRQDGFSLVELLIVMALFVIVLAISADTFTIILRQSSQQAKTAETQIEGIVGLEMLRTDIEHAGYGLPWSYPSALVGYNEASAANACSGGGSAGTDRANYNDLSSSPPSAILHGNDVCFNNSDYLVIKATNIGMNNASPRWSYITYTGKPVPMFWGSDNLSNGDGVIVIKPKAGETTLRQIVVSGNFYTAYSNNNFSGGFSPNDPNNPEEMFVIYGVDDSTPLRMPFNRADYYISRPAGIPSSCAPNTGILYKATFNHGAAVGGNEFTEYPLLDCVADMQVIFYRDTDNDGTIDSFSNNLAGLTAQQIREQVKEVRVYILTHEGQRDPGYTYPNATVEIRDPNFGLIKNFDLSATIGGNWQNYRWKVITLVVKPKNLQ